MNQVIEGVAHGISGGKIGARTMLFAGAGLCLAVAILAAAPHSPPTPTPAVENQRSELTREMSALEACKLLLKGKFPRAKHSVWSRGVSTGADGTVHAVIDVELPARGGDGWMPASWQCTLPAGKETITGGLMAARE